MTVAPEQSSSGQQTVRERILAATLELIAEDGLDAVRHRRVAELAGVSLGSTSYHFASRDDLIAGAFLHFLTTATTALDELRPVDPLSVGDVEVVVDLLVHVIDREFEQPLRVRAEYEMILYAARHESVALELRRWEAAQSEALADMLDAVGVVRPLEHARTLIALVRGIELERVGSPDVSIDVRRRVSDVVAGLLAVSTR